MITLKRLNVTRKVDSEEKAAKLEALGFRRVKTSAPAKKGKAKDVPISPGKEEQNGGTDRPDRSDGAE